MVVKMALLRYIQMVQGMPGTETTTNFYISSHAITKRKMSAILFNMLLYGILLIVVLSVEL